MSRLNPQPIRTPAEQQAYTDALVDHTLANDRGARSAFISHGEKFRERDWPEFERAYDSKMNDCRKSFRSLETLRMAGAL